MEGGEVGRDVERFRIERGRGLHVDDGEVVAVVGDCGVVLVAGHEDLFGEGLGEPGCVGCAGFGCVDGRWAGGPA